MMLPLNAIGSTIDAFGPVLTKLQAGCQCYEEGVQWNTRLSGAFARWGH
jgi:hypothetical protein